MMSIWKKIMPHIMRRIQLSFKGVKYTQDHEVEAKSAFPMLRLSIPVTTQV